MAVERHVEIRGLRLVYFDFGGSGRPLLTVHGPFGRARMFASLAGMLGSGLPGVARAGTPFPGHLCREDETVQSMDFIISSRSNPSFTSFPAVDTGFATMPRSASPKSSEPGSVGLAWVRVAMSLLAGVQPDRAERWPCRGRPWR